MGESGKAVFLSYASQDAAAVARIAEALRAAEVEVWFDQNELVGGDAWDKKIRQQIKECAIFVPVISANTQARPEGYFRLEWLLAVERSRLMSDDHPFLFPVVIDDTTDAAARVPDRFRDVQWTHLNVKDTPESLATRVARVLGRTVGPVADRAPGQRPGLQPRKFGDPWMRRVGVIFALLISLIYVVRPLWKSVVPRETAPPAAGLPAQTAGPQTEAQKLVEKARKIFDEGDEMNRETYTLAEELLKKAETLDVAEGAAWALHAQVSAQSYLYGLDNSPTRREAMLMESARATKLMPDSLDALLASANVRLASRQEIPALEESFKKLAEANPQDPQVLRVLVRTYGLDGKADDASDTARRALRLAPDDPRLKADLVNYLRINNRFAEAEAALTEAKHGRMNARLWAFDSWLKLFWRGDSAGASASIRSWPSWFFLEDRGAALAAIVFMWNREPAKAIEVLGSFPRDEIEDTMAAGPRAAFTAMAREQLGQDESVRADWRVALQVADRKLSTAPDDRVALHWKAWALARLGDRPAASAIFNQLREKSPILPSSLYLFGGLASLAETIGQSAEVINYLQPRRFNWTSFERPLTKGILRLNPVFDPLRGDPRFQALIDAAPGPEEKKENQTSSAAPAPKPKSDLSAVAPAKADDKSVAVLAFDNRSDDKEAEYFSDGISEELIIALGRVPGLTVKGRTSAFFFKGKNATAQEIGEKLGVNYLVRGSVRKAGGKVRITAQLSRAVTDEIVWSSESLERDLKDVFAVQDEIVGLIAKNLSLKLGASPAAATASVNPQAFEFYLQGREAWNRRTREGYDRAEVLFTKAVEVDANFARAYAGLADVFDLRAVDNGEIGRWTQRDAEVFRKMHGVLDRALALDPRLADVQAALGDAFFDEWKPAEAIKALRRSVELNPNYATGWHWLGEVLLDRGEMDEALACLRRAAELEPFSLAITVEYSRCCRAAGRVSDALESSGRALRLHPTAPRALSSHALALIDLGRTGEALPLLRTLLQTDAGREQWQTGMAVVRAGLTSEGDELLARFRRDGRVQLTAPMLAARGNKEAFLEVWQQLPMVTSEPWYLWEPFVDDFRKDPRFLRVLEQTGLTEAHARAQAWRAAHPPEKPGAKQ